MTGKRGKQVKGVDNNQTATYAICASDNHSRDEEAISEKDNFNEAEREAEKLLRKYDYVQIYRNDERLIWNNSN